jgi:hypothetical protein
MTLTEKQSKALDVLEDKETTELLFGGGAGGGKSALGCYWQIKQRLRYPGTRGLIGRNKLKTLKDTTLKTFFVICRLQGVERDKHYKLTGPNDNENPNAIVFTNGSVIYLRDLFANPSDPDFDDLGSLEITDAFIDECNQVTEKAKGIVKSRIRYRLDEFGLIPKLLGTCNPAKNWTYRQFYIPDRDGTIPPFRKFIQSLLHDNEFVSKHYEANLLTLDKQQQERLLHGNWEFDDDPSALISFEAINDYFNPKHLERTNDMYMTIDIARKGKDKTVFRIWDGWVCVHRHAIKKSTLDVVVEQAKKFQREFKIRGSKIIVDEDGVGGGVLDFLGGGAKGFVNNGRPLREQIGESYVVPNYQNLRSQCGFKMAEMIEKRQVGEICNDQGVIDLVSQEMEQIKQKNIDRDGKIALIGKDVIKTNIGRSPDEWDSIMMRYWFALQPKVFTF